MDSLNQSSSVELERLFVELLPDLIEGYENCISHFIEEGGEGDVLELKVQDPFHRLLLHGVCEYHNLVSTTATEQIGKKAMKTTKIKWKNSETEHQPRAFPQDVKGRSLVTHTQKHSCSCNFYE
ncbi:hypothetical protein Bca52824_062104 [Brassica carinata]|uniref:R3H domain-containing protein n=1 Tax=Brassica carinata TaxID=52824 RepID=A0A8X7QHE5_BRACI|nr:hypothetical protein Bca52824_062104 [Brassica carinata]